MPVTTGMAKRLDVPVYFDGVGTARALNQVTVKPQVDGKIMAMSFKEGQEVKKGQVIAKIDPTTYQAQYDQAVAKKALAQTQLSNAQRDLDRYGRVSAGVIAQKTVDTQQAQVDQFKAQIKAEDANIAAAKALVDWTNVVAPIDGRTGLRMVDEGNLVRAGDAGLVTITQLQPISVLFTLPQQHLAQINKASAGAVGTGLAVEALDADGRAIVDRGTLQVIDNQVDQTTGTIKLKADFPNATMQLWPGQFVNVRLLVDTLRNVVAAPTPAVQRGPTGPFVYVVADGAAAVRAVTLGLQTEALSVITGGLEGTEQVVTTGFTRLKDGAKVAATPGAPAPPEPGAVPTPGAAAKPAASTAPAASAAPVDPAAAGDPAARPDGRGKGEGKRRREKTGAADPAATGSQTAAGATSTGSPR